MAPPTAERDLLPIFPLSNVVLFPRLVTPLHIFEERYRQMTAEALDGERRIAMVTVRPDQESAMERDPLVYPVGCAGLITQAQKLPDGRYNIVLVGTHRVRILHEPDRPPEQLYRIAEVERLDDAFPPEAGDRVAALRSRVIDLVSDLVRSAGSDEAAEVSPEMFDGVDDASLVNSLANGFPFAPADKQTLLEADGVPERYERLAGLLRFLHAERLGPKVPNSGTLH